MKHDFIDEHAREQLSALLDGELDGDAARFLQRRLEHDDTLVGQLVRWQLAGDVLRAQARPADGGERNGDLAQRVRAAIEHERKQARTRPRGSWMWWGGGLVAAAALAIAAINLPRSADPIAPQAATQIASAAKTSSPTAVPRVPATTAVKQPEPTIVATVSRAPESGQHRVAAVASRRHQRDATANVRSRERHESRDTPQAEPDRAIALAASTPVKTTGSRNPFTMRAAAPQSELAWPKAVLPGFNSGLNAGFRSDGAVGNPFMPHRPYTELVPEQR